MSLKPIRYPLDLSGKSPDNLVLNEVHQLKPTKIRVFVPTYGFFFTKSFVLRDVATGRVLEKGVDYNFDNLSDIATRDSKQEVCGLVIVVNPDVSSTVSCDYQCIGGLYGYSTEAIIQQIETLKLDNRPAEWGNIFNKPAIYPPAQHLHDIGDVFGFEYIVHALEQLRQAILTGDDGSHTIIYEYIDANRDKLTDLLNTLRREYEHHRDDTSNPHQVTAHQTGTYTDDEIDALLKALKDILDKHRNDYNNPHRTTAAQVGAYDKTQIDTKFNELKNGIIAQLTAHMNDTNNPHQTTAAQVGAYTKEQTNNLLQGVNDALDAHERDFNNPHKVTAAQVGAYTKAQTNTQINNSVNSLRNNLLDPNNNNKLLQSIVPISTSEGNNIVWKDNGLYYKEPPQSVPVGTIIMYPNTGPAPVGFLKCNGTSFSKDVYPALYKVLGNRNVTPRLGSSEIGTMAYFMTDNIPSEWIPVRDIKTRVTQAAYPELYNLLVAKYGSIANTPDMAGRYPRIDGAGYRNGQVFDDAMRSHYHGVGTMSRNEDNIYPIARNWSTNTTWSATWVPGERDRERWTSYKSGNTATTDEIYTGAGEVRPKTVVLTLCIRALDSLNAVSYWIKAFDAISNDSLIDAAEILKQLGNKADRSQLNNYVSVSSFNNRNDVYWENGRIWAKVDNGSGGKEYRQIWPAQWADTV